MDLLFATNNPHKLDEIRAAAGPEFRILSLDDAGLQVEIPETGTTIEANAIQKALFIYELWGGPVFADDTGLEVPCLSNAPGVDTAHYSGSRDAQANMEKLLKEMEPCVDRSARFKTIIAYADQQGTLCFEGILKGTISRTVRGENGFGYDPVFIPQGWDRSFGEMTAFEKAQSNHRVRALEKFMQFLRKSG